MPITLSRISLACLLSSLLISQNSTAAGTDSPNGRQTDATSQFVYEYLVGEIAGQRGDLGLSSDIFLDLAKKTRDPRIAERAAKVSAIGNVPANAIQAVRLWNELDPSSTEAQQASTQILVAAGNLIDAKPYLQKLLAKEDTRANGFLYLNSLLARQPDKAAVLALVQELAAPYPKLPEAHLTTANAAWSAGNTDLAFKELDVADKLRPAWETSAVVRGQIIYTKSPDDALKFYKTYLTKHPEANEVRLTRTRILISQKKYEEAKPELEKLVEYSKGAPEVMVVAGLLAFQTQDYAQAQQYFEAALGHGFKDPDQLYLYLGQIAEKQGQDDQAIAWYSKTQPGERYMDAKLNIANIIARKQGVDEALKMLNQVEDLSEQQQVTLAQAKASLLIQAKRYEKAFNVLDNAVNTGPNTAELIYDYAMAAERTERLDVTETQLRKLIQIRPDYAQAYNALGYTLADRNIKLDEARTLIEKALQLSPNDHYILDSMGWVEYRMGKLDKAAEYLRQAYIAQNDPEIAAHLGEVLWQQGKHDEAIKTWNDALRDFPDNEVLVSTSKKFK
jgi:tetratricopeptide (TPR) repeat protein